MRTEQDYRRLIESGLRGDTRYTPEDIIQGIIQKHFFLFEEDEGILVCQIIRTRDVRLFVFLVSGRDFNRWGQKVLPKLNRFATDQGCSCIEFYARPGLARILKNMGANVEHVILRMRDVDSTGR